MAHGGPVGAAQGTTERQGGGKEEHEQCMWRRGRRDMVLGQRGMCRNCGEERESTSSDIK
jgi:hypothetical protein